MNRTMGCMLLCGMTAIAGFRVANAETSVIRSHTAGGTSIAIPSPHGGDGGLISR